MCCPHLKADYPTSDSFSEKVTCIYSRITPLQQLFIMESEPINIPFPLLRTRLSTVILPQGQESVLILCTCRCAFSLPDSAVVSVRVIDLIVLRNAIYWRLQPRLPYHPSLNPPPCHLLYRKASLVDDLRVQLERVFDLGFSLRPFDLETNTTAEIAEESSSWQNQEPEQLGIRTNSTLVQSVCSSSPSPVTSTFSPCTAICRLFIS